jgi:hypothetical protein
MIGHNIKNFDLPFLVRRSWVNRVDFPASVYEDRYFDRLFVDTAERWLCGQRGNVEYNLNHIAQSLGLVGKPSNCDGAGFHKHLRSASPEEQVSAIGYLLGDLRMVSEVAQLIGL